MKTYTDKELRALDAWTAEHVLGWKDIKPHPNCDFVGDCPYGSGGGMAVSNFTGNDLSLAKIIEACTQRSSVRFNKLPDGWLVDNMGASGLYCAAQAQTIPLALCLFAKLVFGPCCSSCHAMTDDLDSGLCEQCRLEAQCSSCHGAFTDSNPDYGGGVCVACWAKSH